MVSFLTVVHILIAVSLCAMVLVQDSKGGGALGIGGSGSNSLLGATGAQSLAAQLTKALAIFFAVSCVALTYFLAHENKSVVDQLAPQAITAPAPTPTNSVPTTTTTKTNGATSDSGNKDSNKTPESTTTAPAQTAPVTTPDNK